MYQDFEPWPFVQKSKAAVFDIKFKFTVLKCYIHRSHFKWKLKLFFILQRNY